MSQNTEKPKTGAKEHIQPIIPPSVIIVNQPAVRTFSTAGGHGPEDTLTEGDDKITIKKWQGYPPTNLNLIGKSHPAMPEVAIPRYTGKALYATRVLLPDTLHVKVLVSPHARCRIKSIDASKAEKMPGVKYILTKENAPKSYPMPEELFFQGEMVAFVAAETEDQAEDAVYAIDVDYEILPSATSLQQAMAPNPPDLGSKRTGRGNVVKGIVEWGDVDKAFAQADVVKEFSYFYNGGVVFPFQPLSAVAKWDGDNVTMWVLTQRTFSTRRTTARALGIDEEGIGKVRIIDKWNGGSFGGADGAMDRINPWIAHIAKATSRPVKIVFPKDQELPVLRVKPQNLTKFKVGAMKDGRIIAISREFHINSGCNPENTSAINPGTGGGGRSEIYLHTCPNWKEAGYICTGRIRCARARRGATPSKSSNGAGNR